MSSDEKGQQGVSWDKVFRDLEELTARDYGGCEYATLVVHVRKGVPDLCHPIIKRPASASVPTPFS